MISPTAYGGISHRRLGMRPSCHPSGPPPPRGSPMAVCYPQWPPGAYGVPQATRSAAKPPGIRVPWRPWRRRSRGETERRLVPFRREWELGLLLCCVPLGSDTAVGEPLGGGGPLGWQLGRIPSRLWLIPRGVNQNVYLVVLDDAACFSGSELNANTPGWCARWRACSWG